MGWGATHRTARAGADCWAAPDPTQPVATHLPGDLPVRLDATQGRWARVVCENGYSGWIDAGLLVRSRRRAGPVLAGLVVVGGLAAGALLTGGGGDDPGGDDPPAPTSDGDIVALHVPAGWTVSDDGRTAAEDPADLTAAEPDGPVVRARQGEPDELTADGLGAIVDDVVAGTDLELTDPEAQEVDGAPAATIVLRAGGRVIATIVAHPPGEDVVTFTIDCPAERFDELRDLLASVPGLDP